MLLAASVRWRRASRAAERPDWAWGRSPRLRGRRGDGPLVRGELRPRLTAARRRLIIGRDSSPAATPGGAMSIDKVETMRSLVEQANGHAGSRARHAGSRVVACARRP